MPPDTREFTVPRDYLNAWCACQPELCFGDPRPQLFGELRALPERAMPRLRQILGALDAAVRDTLAAAESRRVG